MADVHVVINDSAIHLLARSPGVQAAEARLAAQVTETMRRLCPVGPRASDPHAGALRASVTASREADGSYRIGPSLAYGRWVNSGSRPHVIRSHGKWPLRNRMTGQVFGPVVHHPGTRGVHFIEAAAASIDGEDIRV
jgi:hypothetical protein